MEQRTQEWHEARKGVVTGSRIASVLGVNPFQTRAQLVREMGMELKGAEREFTGNVATQWGEEHEKDAAELYEFTTGKKLEDDGFRLHPDYDFIGVSPDKIGAEFKCPYSQVIPEYPPDHYIWQVNLCMEVYGVDEWDLFYWTPNDSRLWTIRRYKHWFKSVLPKIQDFMEELDKEVDNKAHLEPLVETRNDSGFLNAAAAYRSAKSQLEKAQTLEKQARENLIELAGDKSCKGGGVSVTRFTRQGNVNYKQIPELESVDLEAYRGKPSEQYRLTLDPEGKPIRDVA